jgi:hypothetical protein
VLEQEQSQRPVNPSGSVDSFILEILCLCVVGAALDPLELQKVL